MHVCEKETRGSKGELRERERERERKREKREVVGRKEHSVGLVVFQED